MMLCLFYQDVACFTLMERRPS